MNIVYHASKTQGLTIIQPRISTHDHAWVYATEKPEQALMYLSNATDLIIATGAVNGVLEIVERFEGALEYAYRNVSGSLYQLDGEMFQKGKTSYNLELVSENPVSVIKEDFIQDNLQNILGFEAEGKMKIYRFPNRPIYIPEDKSDLVSNFNNAKESLIRRGKWDQVYQNIEKFHPDIVNQIKK